MSDVEVVGWRMICGWESVGKTVGKVGSRCVPDRKKKKSVRTDRMSWLPSRSPKICGGKVVGESSVPERTGSDEWGPKATDE